jgi:glucokinase
LAANRVIGVDLGGTKILAGVVDREGTIETKRERPTPVESEDALLAALDEAVEELLDGEIAAIGFGIPSTIDQRRGRAISSVNIPLQDVDLRDRVTARFGLPCGIDNDANAAAIAEWKVGAGRGARNLVMLTLGTGVGGGLILDGKPFRGAVGAAAELGHMVIEHDGRPCQGNCTGRGHLEAYLTGEAAERDAEEAYGEAADARTLISRARAGDEVALSILRETSRRMGSALGSLVNIFDPEVIVIGGGFGAAADDFLVSPAMEVLHREARPPGRDLVRVVPAQLGPDAGLIGAGFVAFEAADARVAPDAR